jgi:hypothetical protein
LHLELNAFLQKQKSCENIEIFHPKLACTFGLFPCVKRSNSF